MASKATTNLAEQKLASSGLTLKDAKQLRIDILEPGDAPRSYGSIKDPRPMLLFNYLHPRTGEPLVHQPKFPPASRLRYLGEPHGFEAQVEKAARYKGPTNLPPAAYFPTNLDWDEVLDDPTIDLIITEGELKAAKACKEGFPTIGLGGVWSFKSTRFGCDFIPSLSLVNWVRRVVTIVFDSDLKTNEFVCHAINSLTDRLVAEGAIVKVGFIPADGPEKVGLDDLLVKPDGVDQLSRLLQAAQFLGYARPLWELNERYVFVNQGGYILNRKEAEPIPPAVFSNAIEATKSCMVQELDKEGNLQLKSVSAAKEWITWPLRAAVSRLTYQPGQPQLIESEGDYYEQWNLWPGWGCSPVKGNVKPFLELVDFLFTGADPAHKRWFMQWCSYPIVHPGTKLASAVVLHGEEGIGKGLLARGLGLIYGKNYLEIGQEELESSFNSWAAHRQLIFGDEATGVEHRKYAAKLKKLITSTTMIINEKFVKKYELEACANFIFASNDSDAFTMDGGDRRYFVHEGPRKPREQAFYQLVAEWLRELRSGPALFHYLLHEVDLTGFEPYGRPPMTEAKRSMIEATAPDLLVWCRLLVSDWEAATIPGTTSSELITSAQAMAHYEYQNGSGKPVTKNYMHKMLKKAGAVPACGGMTIKLPNQPAARYLALHNHDKWIKASQDQAQKYLRSLKK